ncbi:hypothetical protein EB796_016750 [Bugula neritina]|uniref:Uncharacterized protein n=1 Tax=Bugula neritina TaxID=10212 RepID=A0A7J7JGH2_BUGNE|nr:hypothetical protein EB796_016750 [Bugula neritina]
MEKKVIIITGANCGIGLEAAKGLCELGHDVVVTTRDDSKGEATVAAIKTEVSDASVMYLTVELSDPQSIRDFVEKFKSSGKKLDILVNNAGLFMKYSSADRHTARNDPSYEVTMTVNCMGPFLLTNLLLDELKATGTKESPSRIVNVSSGLTIMVKQDSSKPPFYIDDLMLTEQGHYVSGMQSYRNSKLALNLWSNEMAKQLEGSHVIINTICPGFIPSTSLARDNVTSLFGSIMMYVLDSFIGRLFVKSSPVSEGRRRIVSMCVDEETKTCGLFYHRSKPTPEAAEVLHSEHKEKIWSLCVKYSGL